MNRSITIDGESLAWEDVVSADLPFRCGGGTPWLCHPAAGLIHEGDPLLMSAEVWRAADGRCFLVWERRVPAGVGDPDPMIAVSARLISGRQACELLSLALFPDEFFAEAGVADFCKHGR